jgi:hypothetical protein
LRPEGKDERHERATGGNRVCEQGKADISTAQLFGHDPRPDDGDE